MSQGADYRGNPSPPRLQKQAVSMLEPPVEQRNSIVQQKSPYRPLSNPMEEVKELREEREGSLYVKPKDDQA